MVRVQPAVVIRSSPAGTALFARVGVVLGFASALVHEQDTEKGVTTVTEAELAGGIALGFTGAVGAEFAISERLPLVAEAACTGMSFRPATAKLTLRTENGVDKLGTMTTRQKETEFQDSVFSSKGAPANDGAPKQSGAIRIPFSSVGLGLGLKVRF